MPQSRKHDDDNDDDAQYERLLSPFAEPLPQPLDRLGHDVLCGQVGLASGVRACHHQRLCADTLRFYDFHSGLAGSDPGSLARSESESESELGLWPQSEVAAPSAGASSVAASRVDPLRYHCDHSVSVQQDQHQILLQPDPLHYGAGYCALYRHAPRHYLVR